jgi:hypothetical protein
MAERVGVNARRFATRVLGEEMVQGYLLAMIKEIAALMKYKVRNTIGHRYLHHPSTRDLHLSTITPTIP